LENERLDAVRLVGNVFAQRRETTVVGQASVRHLLILLRAFDGACSFLHRIYIYIYLGSRVMLMFFSFARALCLKYVQIGEDASSFSSNYLGFLHSFKILKLQRLSPSSSSSYPSGDASSNLFLLFTSFLSFRLLVSFDVGVIVFHLLLGGHESELSADEH